MAHITTIKALTFDVFGTVVDWRSSIIRMVETFGQNRGLAIDGAQLADRWRRGYRPALDNVRQGHWPWMNLDAIHRRILDDVLSEMGLTLPKEDRDTLIEFWHRLDPWPDVIEGLARLKPHYLIAPLSNGHMALMARLSKHAQLPWDVILSAELARHYKPDREVYLTAANLLCLEPDQIMMVAAHQDDLLAAQSVGYRTALVRRLWEWGKPQRVDGGDSDSAFDLVVDDFVALAKCLKPMT